MRPGAISRIPSLALILCLSVSRATAADATGGAQRDLLASLSALDAHLRGDPKLDAAQIEAHKLTLDKHREAFGSSAAVITAALGLVTTYDQTLGPLWVARDGFNRRGQPPANDIHWTVYTVMQHIMDRVYTAENLARHRDLLEGYKFGCSAHFPGAVEPPADPHAVYTVKIDASCPKPFKHEIMHQERPARRPTGAYLAPGSVATITVPPSMAGKGYQVRVGAHDWDNSNKPRVLRLDRSSLVYPISGRETLVASPLGGGIYLEVPLHAEGGIVELGHPQRGAVALLLRQAVPPHHADGVAQRRAPAQRALG
jgi:hypothetical protein